MTESAPRKSPSSCGKATSTCEQPPPHALYVRPAHAMTLLALPFSPPSSMLKNVKGQSEEDNRKRMAVLEEMLTFFKTQARKGV